MTPILLSREDLKLRGISYSPAQLYRKIRDGSFPTPVRLGTNRIAWLEHEIAEWIDAIAVAPRQRKPAPPRPIGGHKGGRPSKKRPAQPNLGAA
jgi:prophage regulatory protein